MLLPGDHRHCLLDSKESKNESLGLKTKQTDNCNGQNGVNKQDKILEVHQNQSPGIQRRPLAIPWPKQLGSE